MIALDTNIFIYVLNDHAEFGQRATDILRGDELRLASELALAEVMSSPKLQNAVHKQNAMRFLEEVNVNFYPADRTILLLAAELRRTYPSLKLADAVHLATAQYCGAEAFITNDQALVGLSMAELTIQSL